jgi:ferrochelatase
VSAAAPTGVLLIQLGTPASPATGDVRRYLREFLSDPRVLDLPALPRWLLLNLVILPRRPRASAAAYRSIWTPAGSPLAVHSRALAEGVARPLGPDFRVEPACATEALLCCARRERRCRAPLCPSTPRRQRPASPRP